MKARYVTVPTLEATSNIADIPTDMLVLGKFRNLEPATLQEFDSRTAGIASQVLEKKKFIGEPGQDVVLTLNDGEPQRKVLFVGLGRTQDYGCSVISQIAARAVAKAAKHQCPRISFPFPLNRASGGLNLKMQAYFIRQAIEAKLANNNEPGELIVEFVCAKNGSAKRELQKGIDMPLTTRGCAKNPDQRQDATVGQPKKVAATA